MDEQRQINLKELSIKCRSQKEMYGLLATDGNVKMPPIQVTNIYYVRRGVVKGEAKVVYFLHNDLIQYIKASQTTLMFHKLHA